jgi:hypothetical protein
MGENKECNGDMTDFSGFAVMTTSFCRCSSMKYSAAEVKGSVPPNQNLQQPLMKMS